MLKAVVETAIVMIRKAILVLWIGIVPADLPEERMELVV